MNLSQRVESVLTSPTIAIAARVRQMKADGRDVVNLGAGEPDFDTPAFIKDAAVAALQAGDTKYTPRQGQALKEAIARKLAEENNLQYKPDQVVVTFGSKHGLAATLQALLNGGDKVLIPQPYWVSYPEMVKLADGQAVFLPTTRKGGYKITPQQLLDAADGAKVMILNSPNNPTGATYTPEELARIAEAVLQTDLVVFSDECYEKLVYGAARFASFASVDRRLAERTVTFNSLSKTFSMTGWRVGWLAAPTDLAGAVRRILSHQTTNPVSFAQAAALAAYTDDRAKRFIDEMRREFEKRGRRMAARLNAMKGVTCGEPAGAFYCFADVSSHYGRKIGGQAVTDSLSFARTALDVAQVALVQGAPFGEDRCVRLSFATSTEEIDKGMNRLEELLS